MHYGAQPLNFKIKKVLRYCRMYGLSRTYVKVQAFRHTARRFERFPLSTCHLSSTHAVGLIGCGNYAFSNIAYYLAKYRGHVIGGCMDTDLHRAASLSRYYRVPFYTTNAAELIEHPQIRLLYVASNHASHAEYAIQALEEGKDVYIEKPHVVHDDQLRRLVQTMERSPGRVYLGFNRPGSRFGRIIRNHLQKEDGTAVFNWFVAGHAIDPDHWYFQPQEGGRVLGNLCHWTDFLLSFAGQTAFPVEIRPTRAARSDVDIAVTYTFGDGSIGVISFSAKGHTFEGVRERFCAHKGNCLLVMDDFCRMTVEVVDRKRHYRSLYRDHGHRDNILGAFDNAIGQQTYDRATRLAYTTNTALLFLRTRESLERNTALTVHAYRDIPACRAA